MSKPCVQVSSMKTWFAKVGVEELECPAETPDLNRTEHLYDEFESPVLEWAQIPPATLQNPEECFPRKHGGYYNCTFGKLHLERDVQKHKNSMVRCIVLLQ